MYIALLVLGAMVSCRPSYELTAISKDPAFVVVDSSYQPLASAESFIEPYRAQLDAKMNRQIGEATTDLFKSRETAENPLGNFAADLLLERSNHYFDMPVDMSVMNFGGLRVNINKGPIYVRTIYELMPFDNQITLLTLSGETVQKLFEYLGETQSIAIANTKLVFTKEGTLKSATIGGKPFSKEQSYTVSISDYLANGGGNMKFLAEATQRTDTGMLIRDAMVDYVEAMTQKQQKITAQVENRVIFE